jgi:hypothetical protein
MRQLLLDCGYYRYKLQTELAQGDQDLDHGSYRPSTAQRNYPPFSLRPRSNLCRHDQYVWHAHPQLPE